MNLKWVFHQCFMYTNKISKRNITLGFCRNSFSSILFIQNSNSAPKSLIFFAYVKLKNRHKLPHEKKSTLHAFHFPTWVTFSCKKKIQNKNIKKTIGTNLKFISKKLSSKFHLFIRLHNKSISQIILTRFFSKFFCYCSLVMRVLWKLVKRKSISTKKENPCGNKTRNRFIDVWV